MKEAEAAFGRRTQQNIRRGKKIRKFEDGIELFVDYFTSDSDESDDTLTTSSASKLNYMPDKMDSGLATESNSGDIKNQGNSKNKTSLSKQSVNAPDSEDAVSFPLTGSKPRVNYQKIYSASTSPSTFAVRQAHLQSKKGSVMQSGTKPKHHSVNRSLVDDFTKFPENVLPHHGEKSLSNSHSDSDKSSQDVVSSSLTGSKHRAYYQKVNSPSSRHLQSKKGSVMQSRTQTKCHSVKKRLADDFTKLPENVSPYHSKKLLSNSVSNSEKSSQDVTSSPLTRSKHKAYYQKVNSPSTRHLQLKKGRVSCSQVQNPSTNQLRNA
ncbi:uncharacterized protein LOC118202969 [Stegodyphus dumicola]|uniref:uncharacterized protein LOC118202969 n=1 Tax=Stegodyphus dumicola TaxID=202533 RepID=UPI0015A9ACEE|nr:uncharacterized protein LOC118202969 [Stegodyphus dumicola]